MGFWKAADLGKPDTKDVLTCSPDAFVGFKQVLQAADDVGPQ